MFLGSELQGRFADTFACYKAGWRHTTMGGYVTPIVAGKLLGLNEHQMANAMGIGGCTNHTISFFTPGIQVSMLKSIAYAFATQRGIEAALLAQKGMTGPENVVEMLNDLIGAHVDLTPTIKGAEKPRILKCGLKPYASEFMSHTPIEAMFKILKEHPLKPEDIESMHLKTYGNAMLIAREEYYTPKNRETADHSIPYCLAIGLMEGDVGPDQFAHEQWKDPRVLDLIARIKVTEDPELDKLYPGARPADLEICTTSGQAYQNRVDYPRGDPNNPMSEEEVQLKFRKLARPLMREKRIQKIIDTVGRIEQVEDVCQLTGLLSV
jgi:2-methylcitrate dehydratase